MKPYIDIEITDDYILRRFEEDIDPVELMWHRDDEDRKIEIIEGKDWLIQLEDQLPVSINESIFIPKHMWHRAIKGTGPLYIKIYKT